MKRCAARAQVACETRHTLGRLRKRKASLGHERREIARLPEGLAGDRHRRAQPTLTVRAEVHP